MLDLVRLSPRRLLPPGGEDLYRQIGRLADLAPGMELLDVACGKGTVLEYFVREHGVHGTGVESDPHLIAEAEAHFRESGLSGNASFQESATGDLPFRDETFDVVIGEVGLAASTDPAQAIEELVRVARPGGRVVLIQLVWQAPVDDTRKQVLSEHLGARPLMAVELRRILMEVGVGDLHTEDWIDADTAYRSKAKKPFPDFAELFSLKEKLQILRRARRRWGWRGVRTVFHRETEVHRLLTKERILGLNLLLGVKASPEEKKAVGDSTPRVAERELDLSTEPEDGRGQDPAGAGDGDEGSVSPPELDGDLQTSGLPLFGPEGADPES